MSRFNAGDVHSVDFPFVRCMATVADFDGPNTFLSWKPGTVSRLNGSRDDYDSYAHGVGQMVLRVVSTHKPAHYPERVFYTREWVTPDGTVFGKRGLRIVTAEKFGRLSRGYWFEFEVSEPLPHEVAA